LKENDIDRLIDVLKDKTKLEERRNILYHFGDKVSRLNSDKFTKFLIQLLIKDSDSEIRRAIAQRFSYVKRIDVMEALCVAMLTDKEPWVRHDAARALGTLNFVEAIPSLVKTTQNEQYKVIRDEAAYSLGQIGDISALPFLAEIVRKDKEISNTAAIAISDIAYYNTNQGVSTLIKLLTIEDSSKLWHVIYALELLREKAQEAVPYLINIVNKNIDPIIQAKAIYALGWIGGVDVKSFLHDSLKITSDDNIKFWIALSHARIFGSNEEGAKELEGFFAYNRLDNDQEIEYKLLIRKWYHEKKNLSKDIEETHKKDIEDILQKIKNGETKTFEFKAYLLFNEKIGEERENKFKIVKTIASMMNSEGGQLIIGVKNSGEIVGLLHDYKSIKEKSKQNRDGFRLFLVDCINQLIGPQYNDLYNISFLDIKDKEICIIDIKPSNFQVHVKTIDGRYIFSIRGEGDNQELDSKQIQEYVKLHERFH